MESLRLIAQATSASTLPCCRCADERGNWDRVAGKPYCPQCEESMVLGEIPPLIERTEKRTCAVCNQMGTLCYLTFPLEATTPVEMDLCPQHFRDLLGRRLGPYAYHQLQRQLRTHSYDASHIFLLHDAFYDAAGRALQPIVEVEG